MCAQTALGRTDCWGEFDPCNPSGSTIVPTHTPELDNARDIVFSADNVCQITASGSIACAGVNTHGQLGRLPISSSFDASFGTVCISDSCVF